MDEHVALAIIAEGAGTQWDPACASALIAARVRLNSETITSITPADYGLDDESDQIV
jgi:HD-GYP domain-containing protein (c-di-GMP phosphodiesterase class II)